MTDFSFNYQREGFNLSQTHNASLYIRVLKNGITLLIELDGALAAWKDFVPAAEITADSQLLQVLTAPYKQVKLGLLPEAFTLIPSAVFDAQDAPLYARYLDVKPDDKVLAAAFDDENYLVGKSGGSVIQLLAQHLDLNQAIPADKGWISAISKSYPTSNQLYLNIDEGYISIANFKSLRLHFYNAFEVSSIDDILYFALFVADQIQLKGNEVTLIVSGNIEQGNEDWNKLTEFFNLVKLADQRTLQLPGEVTAQKVMALAAN